MAQEEKTSVNEQNSDEDWVTVGARRPPLRAGKGCGGRGSVARQPERAYGGANFGYGIGKQERHFVDRKVFVNGLSPSTKEHQLAEKFRNCGQVLSALVCRNADGSSKGFGFVTFSDVGCADAALREGGFCIDGKLCSVSRYDEHAISSTPSCGSSLDAETAAKAREEVENFLTRHELAGAASTIIRRADPKIGLRIVRVITARNPNEKVTESSLHAELNRATENHVSKAVEKRVSDWVQSIGLAADVRQRLLSVMLMEAETRIETVLEMAQRPGWINELINKDNPPMYLLTILGRIRRKESRAEVEAFCGRYGFGADLQHQLNELSTERARRLMKGYSPMGPSQQRQWKEEFRARVAASLHDFTWQKERRKHDSGAIRNHARILAEWSDDEDEWLPPTEPSGKTNVEGGFEAFDADTERSEICAPLNVTASSSRGHKSSDGASATATKVKRRVPKPTHFILCVDTSGSMVTEDCASQDGDTITRLDAVLETCSQFISESSMNMEDRYSFITFNEEPVLHYSCYRAFDAQNELESVRPTAKSQTMFSMGIRGIHTAIRQDPSKLPARVIFLSDGEPTDPGNYLRDVQILMKKYPGDALKIYAVGFGESAKVNSGEGDFTYLQQLACLGHGHFQRCGSSLSSLQGAFTAVTSTISRTRSSTSAGNSRQRAESVESGNQASGSNPWDLPVRTSATSNLPQQHIIATIEEAAEGNESDEDDNSVHSHDQAEDSALPSAGMQSIEFELPNPDQIFNISDSTKWKEFQAALTTFEFDGQKFTRKAEVKRVHLRKKPFMRGGMRLVYGMFHEEHKDKLRNDNQARMCAKRLFQDLDKEQGFSAHAAFVKSTGVAQYYSKLFKQALKDIGSKHKLVFLPCHVYSPIGQDGGFHFCGEELLRGHFVKLNSNAGYVNEADYSEHSDVAQAFSHFTFDKSRGELMVVDLQGVCAESDTQTPYSLLTDPQVHSLGAFEKFGPGDLGSDGMRKFFHGHTCGELCRKLGLRKEVVVAPPTKILPMPGYTELIKHMLGSDSRDFFSDLRRKCRISSITVPREAHSDWIDIKLWGDRGMQFNKARKILEARMEVFFTEARSVIEVDQAMPQWDVFGWQKQIEAWSTNTHAVIIPYPADWKVQRNVRQLWIFAAEEHGWYTDDKRVYAEKTVKEALKDRCKHDVANDAAKLNDEKQGSTVKVETTWEKFQDPSSRKNYWYNNLSGKWFWESDKSWSKYTDDATKKQWWYHNDTGDWFYEP